MKKKEKKEEKKAKKKEKEKKEAFFIYTTNERFTKDTNNNKWIFTNVHGLQQLDIYKCTAEVHINVS